MSVASHRAPIVLTAGHHWQAPAGAWRRIVALYPDPVPQHASVQCDGDRGKMTVSYNSLRQWIRKTGAVPKAGG